MNINNEFVILYFGFVAWYKGADWIVEKIKELCATEKDFTEKTRDLISFIGKIDVEKEVYYLKKYWSYT